MSHVQNTVKLRCPHYLTFLLLTSLTPPLAAIELFGEPVGG
jgi:hypothetical protein